MPTDTSETNSDEEIDINTPTWISRRTRSRAARVTLQSTQPRQALQSDETSIDSSASPNVPKALTMTDPVVTNPVLDADLADVLKRLLEIDINDTPLDEIPEALAHSGINTWKKFLFSDHNDISKISKKDRNSRVAVSIFNQRRLKILMTMTTDNCKNNVPDWKLAATYTEDDFHDTSHKMKSTGPTIVPPPLTTTGTSHGSGMSTTEKALNAWIRMKRSKDDFDILLEDSKYDRWVPKFMSELAVQGLSDIVDPDSRKDPSNITDHYAMELYTKQRQYLWTVLLKVFQNPLGLSYMLENEGPDDSRTAFISHAKHQKDSPARLFATTEHFNDLYKLLLSTHVGNRVKFITDWFTRLKILNEDTPDKLGFGLTRGFILNAVANDDDLPQTIKDHVPTGHDAADIQSLKLALLRDAALADGKDGLSKKGVTRYAKSHDTYGAMSHEQITESTIATTGLDYAVYVANRDPSARLPDFLFSKFDKPSRSAWIKIPPEARKLIVASIDDTDTTNSTSTITTRSSDGPSRKVYFHSADNVETGTEQFYDASDANDDDDTVSVIHDLIVKAAQRPQTSYPKYNKDKKDKNGVLKSNLGPAHPAVLLADDKVPLYDNNGTFRGSINAKMHRWFDSDKDDSLQGTHSMTYNVSKGQLSSRLHLGLIDRGANGMVAGGDCTWIGGPTMERFVSITGIDNHQMNNVKIGTVGALSVSQRGPVIQIYNEVAYHGKNQSIISAVQLEHYRNNVSDKSVKCGGGQRITTADGYIFPLSIKQGLPYLRMRPFTQSEYDTLPHVIMTSDKVWDPSIFDNDVDPNDGSFLAANPEQLHLLPHDDYNVHGEYIRAHTADMIATGNTDDPDAPVGVLVNSDTDDDSELDDFVDSEIFEDAIDTDVTDSIDPIPPDMFDNVNLPLLDSIARCIHYAHSEYHDCLQAFPSEITDDNPDRDLGDYESFTPQPRIHTPHKTDYKKLQPYFAWFPIKMIKETFQNSTQYGFMPSSPDGNLFKRYHSPNPAMNVYRLQDDVLTDTVFSDTPAVDGGCTQAQIFFGKSSHIVHVEALTTTKDFLRSFQNFVRKWGAPIRLLADSAQYQSSFRVLDYLRLLWIGLWQSEPHYQHQNKFERRYQTFKRTTNRLMDRTGTPPFLWLLCMTYVAYMMNRVADPTLNNTQPIFRATGKIGDISPMLVFTWLEPVYFKVDDSPFPSASPEALGYFVGIAEHVGHTMTFLIFHKATQRILPRSTVRSALDPAARNLRAKLLSDPSTKHDFHLWQSDLEQKKPSNDSDLVSTAQDYGEKEPGRPPDFIYSKTVENEIDSPGNADLYGENAYLDEHGDSSTQDTHLPDTATTIDVVLNDANGQPQTTMDGKQITIPGRDPKDLQGVTFRVPQPDGTTLRARITGLVDHKDKTRQTRLATKKLSDFTCKYDTIDIEDTIAYNDVMNYLHRDEVEEGGISWKFRRIIGHEGPLDRNHPNHKGSPYNVMIEWENGETTHEPISKIHQDDPITLAKYAKDNDLLDTVGWKRCKPHARRTVKLNRLIKQVKLRSFRTSPKYMYGYLVPRNYKDALRIDTMNGNNKWIDSIKLEMQQLDEYDTFIDVGMENLVSIPEGFTKIKVHLVFAVKHDARHKSRMCANGNLTPVPLNSVYSGVVSLRGLRLCIFAAELNGMEAYATDIGNAYLEARTQEKVCIKAGPEFGEREGHLLIIYKALYGLRSSGKEFGDLLAACLRELGFKPSKAEAEIFMRERGGLYEYVATYVDDLCLVMKDPEAFLEVLKSAPYHFKLKGSGPMAFHLGCGFERDDDGILCMDPKKYIEKMIQSYEQLYGEKPNQKFRSPLEDGDQPGLDTSEFLDEDGISQYQSLVGSMQWAISLGRLDIQTAVMTLSRYRAQPRKGHLERCKRVYGYITRFKHFRIKFRVSEPNMSAFDNKTKLDWSKTAYGDPKEDIPHDAPVPLGKRVTLIHYFDANLMHDVLSGKAVTGCIHFINKTPIMWYSKMQATTETATFGAEFISARTCIEQIVDLRNSLRYMGIPINNISYVFGDNKSMIDSASFPDSRLNKRHNILSYHYVRSMVACGHLAVHHVTSASNLADVLSKHWSYNSVYRLLQPIFHHFGNTASLYQDDDPDCLDSLIDELRASS